MTSRLRGYLGLLVRLRRFLNETVSEEQAAAIIRRRLAEREERFLRMLDRCVFGNPRSPYSFLLRAAGCTRGDLAAELGRYGLDDVLRHLRDGGVRVSLEEFKGREPIARGSERIDVSAESFDNPLVSGELSFTTGGSTGRSSRVRFDLEYMTERAPCEHLLFRMLGLHDVPLALWFPELPANTGIATCLRYGKIGQAPDRWFAMRLQARPAWAFLATRLVVALSRRSESPFPWPRPLGLDEASLVVDWVLDQLSRHRRCAVQTYVSAAVRVCQNARDRGADIAGTQFVVGSEPISAAKQREIERVGARVYTRYAAVEAGTIAMGCGANASVGNLHVLRDTMAVIDGGGGAGAGDSRSLLVTSLLDVGPKVMINVDLGDVGVLDERRCGCLLEASGLVTHLSSVTSAKRASGEGMTVPYADLVRIAEEVLPARFGGSSLDYQWLETEDERSLTRFRLRIAPSVGVLDVEKVSEFALEQLVRLDARNRFHTEYWRAAGTLQIAREDPTSTHRGKLLPLVRSRVGE